MKRSGLSAPAAMGRSTEVSQQTIHGAKHVPECSCAKQPLRPTGKSPVAACRAVESHWYLRWENSKKLGHGRMLRSPKPISSWGACSCGSSALLTDGARATNSLGGPAVGREAWRTLYGRACGPAGAWLVGRDNEGAEVARSVGQFLKTRHRGKPAGRLAGRQVERWVEWSDGSSVGRRVDRSAARVVGVNAARAKTSP